MFYPGQHDATDTYKTNYKRNKIDWKRLIHGSKKGPIIGHLTGVETAGRTHVQPEQGSE